MLFRSPTHVEASRAMFKSLNVGNEVSDGIIDCWAEVLNFQEKRKSREAYSRQFFGTKVVVSVMYIEITVWRVFDLINFSVVFKVSVDANN